LLIGQHCFISHTLWSGKSATRHDPTVAKGPRELFINWLLDTSGIDRVIVRVVIPAPQQTMRIVLQLGMARSIDGDAIALVSRRECDTKSEAGREHHVVLGTRQRKDGDEVLTVFFELRESIRNAFLFVVHSQHIISQILGIGQLDLDSQGPILDDHFYNIGHSQETAVNELLVDLTNFEIWQGWVGFDGFDQIVFLQALVSKSQTIAGPAMRLAPAAAVAAFQLANAFPFVVGTRLAQCPNSFAAEFPTTVFLACAVVVSIIAPALASGCRFLLTDIARRNGLCRHGFRAP